MSIWKDLPPEVVELVLRAGVRLGEVVWHKLTGQESDEDTAKALQRAAIEAAARAIADEVERQAARRGLAIALDQLDHAAESVVDAFEAKGSIPPLDLEITLVEDEP
jgi:hypothetical protein